MAVPVASERQGWAWISRLQRYASVRSVGTCARRGTRRLSAGTKRPPMNTAIASGAPSRSGRRPSPTPSSAIESRPADASAYQRVTSTRSPARPSNAGSRVTEASIVTATVVAAPIPRPEMKARPMSSMPSNEMTTVSPAKMTARPAVFRAAAVASSGESPAWRPSR